MEHVGAILEHEGEVLETLLFKLVVVRLLLEADEVRHLARATAEVERARARAREVDLLRAATVADHPERTLRDLAGAQADPWPAILRDHHAVLSSRLAEIEVVAHRNAELARAGLDQLRLTPANAGAAGGDPRHRGELARLARGAALEAVLGTAARLRMPDLVEYLR